MNIFKTKNHLENVERCKIRFATEGDEDRLVIQLFCKFGVLETHKLHYEPCEPILAVYAKHACRHKWTVSPKVIHDWLSHFHKHLEEVTMRCGVDWVHLKSFTENLVSDERGSDALANRSIQTELQIDVEDFDVFAVQDEVRLSFCLKELKAVLSLAETMGQPVSAFFDHAGSAITFSISQGPELYIGDFVIATLQEVDAATGTPKTQTQPRSTPAAAAPSQRQTPHHTPSTQRSYQRSPPAPLQTPPPNNGDMDMDEHLPPSPPHHGPAMHALVSELDASRRVSLVDSSQHPHGAGPSTPLRGIIVPDREKERGREYADSGQSTAGRMEEDADLHHDLFFDSPGVERGGVADELVTNSAQPPRSGSSSFAVPITPTHRQQPVRRRFIEEEEDEDEDGEVVPPTPPVKKPKTLFGR
ncbi:Cell cycle checkpoint control protein rad9b [Borealophlyctis nickersoniae]|nr:Cell cycle checkpoint control protein rad9b [Borealophlyctis nickersoniae]